MNLFIKLSVVVQQNIVDRLTLLNGHNPPLPVAPIAGQEPGIIRDLLQQLISSQEPAFAAAIRAGAEARVNQLKAQLANQVANSLTSQLNRSFSFYDSWTDPVNAGRIRPAVRHWHGRDVSDHSARRTVLNFAN